MKRGLASKKRGISEIIVTLIIIGLTLVATTIAWSVINSMITDKVKNSEACFGNLDKINLNKKFTCYNSANSKARFTINVGDIDVDDVLVSITDGSDTKTFSLTNQEQDITGLFYFTGNYNPSPSSVKLPQKNGGKSYLYSWAGESPTLIQIAPKINGVQCEASDSIQGFDDCSTLAS